MKLFRLKNSLYSGRDSAETFRLLIRAETPERARELAREEVSRRKNNPDRYFEEPEIWTNPEYVSVEEVSMGCEGVV